MSSIETAIGSTIKEIRKSKGWFAVDLAEQIPMSRSYLSEVEQGHKAPSLGLLPAIAAGLGLTMADFWLAVHKNISKS